MIIQRKKTVIVAADVSLGKLAGLAGALQGVDGISAFKIGITLMTRLKEAVQTIRAISPDSLIIYDHQKAGNDIPDMGKQFAETLKEAGINVAILFPFAGPATQEAWTKSCFDAGLSVITGGVMTHPKFLVSEGGYIADDAVERIYRLACQLGVTDFVVPGTKINWVQRIHALVSEELGAGNFALYAPGFINQGGEISECAKAAGDIWHAIVGSAVYKQLTPEDQRKAAITVTSQIIG